MNKKFFTLVALLGLFVSFGVSAAPATTPLVSGNYYFIKTNDGNYYAVEKLDAGNRLKKVDATERDDAGSLALWKVVYSIDKVTGEYVYTITNKSTEGTLSFGDGVTAAHETSGVLKGSLNFAIDGWDPATMNADGTAATCKIYSYIPGATTAKDSTMYLRGYSFEGTAGYVRGVKIGGNYDSSQNGNQVTFEKPATRDLTVEELNEILAGSGFQMFAFYDNNPIVKNEYNPLSGVRFIAEGPGADPLTNNHGTATATEVNLRAAKSPVVKGGVRYYNYAFVDSVGYNATTPTSAGEGMTYRIDTLSAGNAKITKTLFTFTIDPSLPDPLDSVIVKVYNSYNDKAVPATKIESTFPMQVDKFTLPTDKFVLTTGIDGLQPDKHTRISLNGGETPSDMLDIAKVYSVQILNTAEDYSPSFLNLEEWLDGLRSTSKFNNKYAAVSKLLNLPTVVAAPSVYVPATQFIFQGSDYLVNRENNAIRFRYLYPIEGKEGQFTNGTDTILVKEMDVDPTSVRVGYAYVKPADITNKVFTFNYNSGILSGRSINVNDKSILLAEEGAGLQFRFSPVEIDGYYDEEAEEWVSVYDEAFGPTAIKDGVVQLKRQSYILTTVDGKKAVGIQDLAKTIAEIIAKVNVDDLNIDAVNSIDILNHLNLVSYNEMMPMVADMEFPQLAVPFILRATANKDEYTLHPNIPGIPLHLVIKYNVNSNTAVLESVRNNLNDNGFSYVDADAAPYVLDAGGHVKFTNGRTEAMTRDTKDFGAFAFVNEAKADTYTEDDFKLYLDSASKADETRHLYYILKGAVAPYDSHELSGFFLRNMVDSVYDADGNEIKTTKDTYYHEVMGVKLPRLKFVEAKRFATGGDSLLLNYASHAAEGAKFVATDSIGFAGGSATAKAQAYKKDQFRFAIRKNTLDDGFYRIENNADCFDGKYYEGAPSYVAIHNNVLYLTPVRESALLVTMNENEAAPTANDDAVEAGVQVYTNNGAVIVKGAAGKVVNITNVLGQTIVNKTAATDYESFAAAGVVIVKVDGKVFKVSTY